MSVAELTRLSAEKIKPNIGSRVLNTKEELLAGDLGPQLRELLEESGILVFPKIGFTDAEQIAFTKTLGTFAPEMQDKGGEEKIHKITLDIKENPSSAEYLKGSLYWHIDGTMNKVPILASLLSCLNPSPKGTGNTGFANTYAAYDALSDEKKAEIAGYRVNHGAWASLFYYSPEPKMEMLDRMQGIGEQELPLVWTHKSGRKSLVLGNTAINVVGKGLAESQRILHGLREWATQDDFTYSHEWSVGDLVIWDNTGTMHRAEPYDPACNRMMHRTKLQGEESFEKGSRPVPAVRRRRRIGCSDDRSSDAERAMHELAPYLHHVDNTCGMWLNGNETSGVDGALLKPMSLEAFKASGIMTIPTPTEAIDYFRAIPERIPAKYFMVVCRRACRRRSSSNRPRYSPTG